MDFFDKLGKKASEAYKMTADKTGKIAKETKMKLKMNELKAQINEIYEEIGKKVYEQHVREEKYSIEKEIEEECTKIDVISDEIETLLKQCLELKDKKQCKKCYKEIEKDMKFCPDCGEKQEEKQEEKSIVVERVKEDEKRATETNLENKDEQSEKTNLEKTVEIESNIDVEANIEEEENQ